MSTNDYVKYVTQQLVKFMDTPRETRKKQREERKTELESTFYSNRWFGVLPFAFKLFIKKRKYRVNEKQ
ncbi:YqzE family protein [Metabacillus sp. HB246100]|uniref:YqzE family protein n=1 Tax=Bacillus weihaiensis TaxID=1547283 RepID=UPI002356C221|nr:YqzE family protein [Bacillus weihaiensis]